MSMKISSMLFYLQHNNKFTSFQHQMNQQENGFFGQQRSRQLIDRYGRRTSFRI
jgi:hypothetical protein